MLLINKLKYTYVILITYKTNGEMVVERVCIYAIILLNLSKVLYILIKCISLVIFITFLIIILVISSDNNINIVS